ncbi:MAG: lycopene cyclase domain-containing protein [Patescibacteria group bacterium]
MAFTYLVINLIFIVCIVVMFMQYLEKPTKSWWVTFGILVALTAVFDSIIIWAGIVGYNPEKILGAYIGFAPLEDFFYAALAIIIVPALWNLFDPNRRSERK